MIDSNIFLKEDLRHGNLMCDLCGCEIH